MYSVYRHVSGSRDELRVSLVKPKTTAPRGADSSSDEFLLFRLRQLLLLKLLRIKVQKVVVSAVDSVLRH